MAKKVNNITDNVYNFEVKYFFHLGWGDWVSDQINNPCPTVSSQN